MSNRFVILCICILVILLGSTLSAQTDSSAEIEQRLHNADSLRRKIKYSDAWTQLAMITAQQNEMTPEQLAKFHKLIGVTQYGFGNYDLSLESYKASEEVLKTIQTDQSKVDQANIKTSFGTVFNKKGEYEKAKDNFVMAIELGQSLPEEDKLIVIKVAQNNLANTYELLGQYDNSVNTSKEVLKTITQLGAENSISSGVAHNSLGVCYRQLGRYKLAKHHYEKAAEIFTEILGPNSPYTHAALGNAATAIDDYGDAEKAIPILMRKLDFFLEDPGADQIYIANTYSTLGWVYKRIGDYDKSINSYEKALGKLRSFGYTRKDLEIRILKSLASAELLNNSMEKARKYLDEAFALQATYPELAPADLVRLYNNDATYYQLNHQEQEAFSSIQKAYRTSVKDSLNELNLILTTTPRYIHGLIKNNRLVLAQKVIDSTNTFVRDNLEKLSTPDQHIAFANLDALRVNLLIRQGNSELAIAENLDQKLQEHAKQLIELTALTPGKKNQRYSCATCFGVSDILETLASLHLALYQKDVADKETQLAQFLTVLDIKASYLRNVWNYENFSDLSVTEREDAKEIRQRIAAYDLLIFENEANSPRGQRQSALYLDSILVLRPQLASYIKKLSPPPIDFDRTFNFKTLDENQCLVLYHQQNDALHVLSITSKGLDLNTLQNADDLRSAIETYRLFCNSASGGFSESLATLTLGAKLYTSLLPNKIQDFARIAVIENYPVENLPFAALLSQAIPTGAKGFRDIHFAVEEHSFSYHQSPSSFFNLQASSSFDNTIELTALAPSQVSSSPIASLSTTDVDNIGLAYANQEVETLVYEYKGTLLSGKQADYQGFNNAFKQSNVVHIASHASSNLNAGEYSYLIITDTASLSGERLYARTISELELPADLVVLAACESGSGKLSNGEGTMSLSNVFLNAGTKSVLHTSWRVEDKKSQDILLSFYERFAEQQPLDEALSQSQRTYLQTAGGQYLHPFYWAPFEISGKLSPLDSSWDYLAYGGGLLALGLALFFFFRFR